MTTPPDAMTENQKKQMRRTRARIVRLLMDVDDEFVEGVSASRAASVFREVARLAMVAGSDLDKMAKENVE
jgi:hypothetical protein